MRTVAFGVDVGGTYAKIVSVTADGSPLGALGQVETLPRRGPARFVERLLSILGSMGARQEGRLAAVGLGVAGEVDSERGSLRVAPNLRSFEGFSFKKALESRLGVPVAVENDANAAAWGAYALELGRRVPHVVCLTLGTGVGGGVVLDGRLHHGATGSAGEIGHMRVVPDGEPCHCGSRGCLEAYAGAYAIVREARRQARGSPRRARTMVRLWRKARALDTKVIAEAARRRDPVARDVLAGAARALAVGILNVTYLLNPGAVVLAGGVAQAGGVILNPLKRVLAAQPFKAPFRSLRIVVSRNPHLGACGAALLALDDDRA